MIVKRETQSHRKVVLLISSTFRYKYIYIYIYISALKVHLGKMQVSN